MQVNHRFSKLEKSILGLKILFRLLLILLLAEILEIKKNHYTKKITLGLHQFLLAIASSSVEFLTPDYKLTDWILLRSSIGKALALRAGDRKFDPWLGHIKDHHKNGTRTSHAGRSALHMED